LCLPEHFTSDDDLIGPELKKLNIGAAQFFTNAVNTTSRGADAILTYFSLIFGQQNLKFSVASNFNDMEIDKIYTNQKLQGKKIYIRASVSNIFYLLQRQKAKLISALIIQKGIFSRI